MKNIYGKLIGEGKFRKVYEYLPNKQFVVKVNKPFISNNEVILNHDYNLEEYKNFLLLKKYDLDIWVAECFYLNDIFLMRRVDNLPKGVYRVPTFFPERKKNNYGWLNQRIVCIDYPEIGFKNDLRNEIKDNYIKAIVNEDCLLNYKITKRIIVK